MNDESSGTETGPGWGWLAAAAAVGLWAARKHPRAAVAVGLGLAVWRCLSDRPEPEEEIRTAADPVETVATAEADEADTTAGQGGWLLNLEPVPLVIREEGVPAMGQGQGDGLLNQEPGQMVEELDWVPPVVVEEFWLNEGVDIPDAVELPELEEPSGTGAPGQA